MKTNNNHTIPSTPPPPPPVPNVETTNIQPLSAEKKIILNKKLRIFNHKLLQEELGQFYHPSPNCALCCSICVEEVHKEWLNKPEDMNHAGFVRKHDRWFFKKTGTHLTPFAVKNHFENHLNAVGAAEYAYTQTMIREKDEKQFVGVKEDNNNPKQLENISPGLKRIYDLLEDKYLNDLKIMDFTIREQLEHVKDLRIMRERKMREAEEMNIEPYGVDGLIMKEESILNNIYNLVLRKISTFQQGKLQQAQVNAINIVMSSQMMGALGVDPSIALNPVLLRKSQFLFVSTITNHLLQRVKSSLESVDILPEQKAQFYSALKGNLTGVEQDIFSEFEELVKETNANIQAKLKSGEVIDT